MKKCNIERRQSMKYQIVLMPLPWRSWGWYDHESNTCCPCDCVRIVLPLLAFATAFQCQLWHDSVLLWWLCGKLCWLGLHRGRCSDKYVESVDQSIDRWVWFLVEAGGDKDDITTYKIIHACHLMIADERSKCLSTPLALSLSLCAVIVLCVFAVIH